jgi:hypothetical protein
MTAELDRRGFLKRLSLTAGALLLPVLPFRAELLAAPEPDEELLKRLAAEPAAASAVRVEGGTPRLTLNGQRVLPRWGMSVGLLETAGAYRKSGIDLLSPILGLDSGWTGPGKYDWSGLDRYLFELLSQNPDAFFLPRVQLNAPRWWEDAHPEELVKYGRPVPEGEFRMEQRRSEGGFDWNYGRDALDPSMASEVWIAAASDLLCSYLRHVEKSPLKSRIMGYHFAGAMTSEWHYIGSRYLPDYSEPMKRRAGPLPSPEERMQTTAGLFRDPAKEGKTIEFYRRLHENTAEVIGRFAAIVKKETDRRVVCGTFYGYLLENVMIQEAGHLAPRPVLECADLDFLASPYTYQHTNVPGMGRWESDVVDGAGNLLGRARGVAGDGAYRVPAESVKRHGKLFIVEWDPSTYLEPAKLTEGGSGSTTVKGTLRILERDMGRALASGIGGWFLEFGHLCPPFKAKRGWYDDKPMIELIRKFGALGLLTEEQDASSVSEVACVVDPGSFLVTQHWTAEKPWKGFGIAVTDFFDHWFLNSQSRSVHRLGAPSDFLFRFDLEPADAARYRLFLMMNPFYLTDAELKALTDVFKDSGATVIWTYAPGFVAPDRLDRSRMEALTGFHFRVIERPGPLMIKTTMPPAGGEVESVFGVPGERGPRFAVVDEDVEKLGRFTDGEEVAFARKEHDGYHSVYLGAAPLPVKLLRRLAKDAGVRLWSSEPDIVTATAGTTCLVATSEGEREVRFDVPQRMIFNETGTKAKKSYQLDVGFGDVRLFVAE